MYILLKGKNPVLETLKSGKRKVYVLYIYNNLKQDSKLRLIKKLAKEKNIKIKYVDKNFLKKLDNSEKHQGIIAKTGGKQTKGLKELFKKNNAFILILEGIKDPRNFGSILRTAEAAGVDAVIIPDKNFAPLNSDAVKSSAGASEYVNIVSVKNTTKTILSFKKRGFIVIGADMDGKKIYNEINYKTPIVIVVGGEDSGIKRITKDNCDFIVKIPMLGKISSLNVAVSTALILYEVVRQRNS